MTKTSAWIRGCLGFLIASVGWVMGLSSSSTPVTWASEPPSSPAQTMPTVQGVATGSEFTCALLTSGQVQCWGQNESGQLGDGTLVSRQTAAAVAGLPSAVTQVVAGEAYACVLAGGNVWCWGRNTSGQLGDGTTQDRALPTPVSGLTGVVALSTGLEHTCAQLSGGSVKCWGRNNWGQLGNGTTINQSSPVDVIGLTGAVSVGVGSDHTCAIVTGGGVKCWGANSDGRLGNGVTTWDPTPTPVDVVGLHAGAVQLALHGNTCALLTTGRVECWGWSAGTPASFTPIDIGLTDGTAITAGQFHACLLRADHSVMCWGANWRSQSGQPHSQELVGPSLVVSNDAVSVASRYDHTCIITTTGALRCWGENHAGQLGNDPPDELSQFDVPSLTAQSVTVGGTTICVLTPVGGVQCWGDNSWGQLGLTDPRARYTPTDVPGLSSGIVSVSSGPIDACAIKTTGAVMCWGANFLGQVGNGITENRSLPTVEVALGEPAVQVTEGNYQSCAVLASGSIKCWGNTIEGLQLTPTLVPVRAAAVEVDAGNGFVCARLIDGGVQCWGDNLHGQLGMGTFGGGSTIPLDVVGLNHPVVRLVVADAHSCVLLNTGGVQCWGNTGAYWGYGRLGDGTYNDSAVPVDVFGLSSGVVELTASVNHTCARHSDGRILCWGGNNENQLGTGTRVSTNAPVEVSPVIPDVQALVAGGDSTCVLRTNGTLRCWGSNNYGQFGMGEAAIQEWPSSATVQPLPTNASVTIHVHAGDAPGVGRAGYLVRIYNAVGTEIANKTTDATGDVSWSLNNGTYQYRVDRAGAQSARQTFSVAGVAQTLTYRLATVTVKTADRTGVGKAGYLVRVFNGMGGSGAEWGNATTNANGEATFYLLEGDYGYRIDRAGAQSAKVGFAVIAHSDQFLSYTLATVTVKTVDNMGVGKAGYLVRIFNDVDGSGTEWGNATTNANGEATFYLVEGSYGFRVDRAGARSAKVGFSVAAHVDQTLTYTLAAVTIKVADSAGLGKAGYLVRLFNGVDGSGSEWGNATTNASGEATFYLVEGDFGYRIDRAGAQSAKVGFTVAAHVDQTLTYTLAKVTVKTVDSTGVAKPGYLVRVFNGVDGSGTEWGNATTNASGEATFYLVEGSYGYRVDRAGAISAKIGFTVIAHSDRSLTFTLARITVHVQTSSGVAAPGYLVRLYNGTSGSGTEWGNQTTNAAGQATFDVPSGGFQYQVERSGYNSGRLPPSGVSVAAEEQLMLTHTLP